MITDFRNERVLVLVPHRDDEALSCGGTLLQCKHLNLMYFNYVHPNVSQSVYDKEADEVRKALNCEVSYSEYTGVNKLDTVPIHNYIQEIEYVLQYYHPYTVIIPHPSYNQDHRVVYNAALTAIRIHDKNPIVKMVLTSEQPETHSPSYLPFRPGLFVPIDIVSKLELYRLYQSQQRKHRTAEHLRAIAAMRGMQSGYTYAEAFGVVRIIL